MWLYVLYYFGNKINKLVNLCWERGVLLVSLLLNKKMIVK